MYLAVDYGERYVGLAATDPDGKIPFRYGTIDQRKQKVVEELVQIISKERIQTVLLGWPVNLSGQETRQTQVTRAFRDLLQAQLPDGVSLQTVDETLSSVEAQANLHAEGVSGDKEHEEAARLLLVDYLH